MKILNKITLILFSIMILIVAIITILLLIGWLNFSTIAMLYHEMIASSVATNIALGSSIICALLALRAIFYSGSTSNEDEERYFA